MTTTNNDAVTVTTMTTMTSADSNSSSSTPRRPCFLSLDELQIQITKQVYDYLAEPFRLAASEAGAEAAADMDHDDIDDEDDDDDTTPLTNGGSSKSSNSNSSSNNRSCQSLNCILQRMKIPPKTTILRWTQQQQQQRRQHLLPQFTTTTTSEQRVAILEQVQVAMEEWIQIQMQQNTSSSCSASATGVSGSATTITSPQPQLACHVKFHPIVSDVITINIQQVESNNNNINTTTDSQETKASSSCSFPPSLYSVRGPPPPPPTTPTTTPTTTTTTTTTTTSGSGSTHHANTAAAARIVIVDRLCGEAILRGADVFVKGILVADANIVPGTVVAVYADLERNNNNNNNCQQPPESSTTPTTTTTTTLTTKKKTTTTRGLPVQHYTGQAVFLGLGTAACRRALFFSSSHGLGVQMSALPWQRAGPVLPPLSFSSLTSGNGCSSDGSNSSSNSSKMAQLLASGRVYAQNLPSTLVAHVLEAQPGHVIFDMCAAPGGKTSHVAQLVGAAAAAAMATTTTTTNNNNTIIVMADKSRKKVVQARDLFQRLLGDNSDHDFDCTAENAACPGLDSMITPLCLDSTNCVERRHDIPRQSVQEILSAAVPNPKDGLLQVTRFFPESFHRILLDPPCSALGLRPKFKIPQQTVQELKSLVKYQQGFVREAIHLLQVDGIMTYSTCTMNYHENEGMVCHILKEYPCMELLPIPSNLGGRPGLILRSRAVGGGGLNEIESSCVRRFGSTDDPDDDTIGFFIAKFRKLCSVNPF